MSNAGSEQTFENLVDNVLSQLKKSMTFGISECLGSQYYHYWIFFLLKYVVFKTFFLTVLCNFLAWVDGSVAGMLPYSWHVFFVYSLLS